MFIVLITMNRKEDDFQSSTNKQFIKKLTIFNNKEEEETNKHKGGKALVGCNNDDDVKFSRPGVCRKLCFDVGCSSQASNKQDHILQPKIKKKRVSSFNAELQNLLNISIEENRQRCIEKYNFDPIIEKSD